MQTFMKRVAVLAMCLVMLLQFAACDANDLVENATVDQLVSLWSLPSTVKPDKAGEHDLAGGAALTYYTVKNEYESHQLLLTAKDEISAYFLEASDLTSPEGNVLSKDNFTVYMERFLQVTDKATEYGSYNRPDALIPLDAALEHGELTIVNGENGALWVTVYVPAETPAGTYTGNFKLAVENAVTDIPVTVTVNDYTLPETSSGKTLFSWRYDRVGAGELDSSIEMMETYYEFFQDYRVSLQSMPLESTTKEEIKEAFDAYYDTLTTYTLMPEPGKVPGGGTLAERTKDMIYYIAQLSGEDGINYFEKAMIYAVDEPDLTNEASRTYAITMVENVNAFLQQCVDVIEADTTGAYDSFKQIANWEDSILNIPNIMPLTYTSAEWLINSAYSSNATTKAQATAFLEVVNTVCAIFDMFSGDYATKLLALCEQYGIENIWWYGCTGPRAPWGNYHIGDELIRSRTLSWVQAQYGIEGNLYWDAAAYTDENPLYLDQYINVYEFPYRRSDATWPAGDGFLTYPGAAYGVYGPLPSLRLMSIRDGMEELEMLNALKAKGTDVTTLVNGVCNSDSSLKADGTGGFDFTTSRKSLIDQISLQSKGVNFMLTDTVVEGSDASVSYYADEENKVYIDGELQTSDGEGNYTYEMDLKESSTLNVQIEAADGTKYEVSQFIANPTTVLQNFDDASVLNSITVSEGGSVELAETEGYVTSGSSAHFQVTGKVTGDTLVDAAYVPTVKFDIAALNEISDLTEVKLLKLDAYNPGEPINIRVKIYSGSSFASVGEFTMGSGKTTLSMSINTIAFSAMKDADSIVFEFENSADGETANAYEFYLDNMVAAE